MNDKTTTRAECEIDAAIARSISHNEIVTLDHAEDLELELDLRADDSASTDAEIEYWGEEGRREWRVHLRLASSDE